MESVFASAGYNVTNAFGSDTTVSNVLAWAESMEEDHDCVALFHFGHGGYTAEYYDYFDNGWNEIKDTDILYQTSLGKHFFVFLWVCFQAEAGPSSGMPAAWTHATNMSDDGYHDPDEGNHCFVGFVGASPTLLGYSFRWYNVYGEDVIGTFYTYMLDQGYSINDALDLTSLALFSYDFDEGPLVEYQTWWPYDFGEGMGPGWYAGGMRIFGNGNIYLAKEHEVTVTAKDQYGNSYPDEDVYIDDEYVGKSGNSFTVSQADHTIEISVPDGYVFLNYTYSGGSSTYNPAELSVSSDITVTAYYAEDTDHSLTILAYNQYMQQGYVQLWIDGDYVGTTGYSYTVEAGYHEIEVEEIIWDYPYIHTFDHYEYDSTTNYNNPITLPIIGDKTVIAYYNTYLG